MNAEVGANTGTILLVENWEEMSVVYYLVSSCSKSNRSKILAKSVQSFYRCVRIRDFFLPNFTSTVIFGEHKFFVRNPRDDIKFCLNYTWCYRIYYNFTSYMRNDIVIFAWVVTTDIHVIVCIVIRLSRWVGLWVRTAAGLGSEFGPKWWKKKKKKGTHFVATRPANASWPVLGLREADGGMAVAGDSAEGLKVVDVLCDWIKG